MPPTTHPAPLHSFADLSGRRWDATITVGAIRRVKALLAVDLLADDDGQLFIRLASDPELLVNVLYVVCKPQADAAGITDEQFGERLGGDALADATRALLEAWADFFPNPRDRARKRRALAKMDEWTEKADNAIDRMMSEADADAAIDKALQTLGERFTASLASSASTPDP